MDPGSSIIMAAPTGARKSKADHPQLPLTLEDVASEAKRCAEQGASALHLHARDKDGRHTLDPEIYRQYIKAAEQAVGGSMVIQITTEAVGMYNCDEQMNAIRALRPAAATFAVRELVPNSHHEDKAGAFFREIAEWGCSPQFILFDEADAFHFAELVGHGVIPQRQPCAIFVLGRYQKPNVDTGDLIHSNARNLIRFLSDWPQSWPWFLCAFGATETRSLLASLALGGHARVGFENNHLNADGSVAQNNAERVKAIANGLAQLGGSLMGYSDTKKLFENAAII